MMIMETWMNHPAMSTLDPAKLELIKMAAKQTQGKTGKSLASVLLSLIVGANKQGLRFTAAETDLILEILKEGKSEQERKQIDHMVSSVQQTMQKGRP